MFFINNLQEKAVESGLPEDALLPTHTAKDKQVLKYLKRQLEPSRPPSATNESVMRSSFYSMGTGFDPDESQNLI